MRRVVIVGGGVSGLICSYAFQKYDNTDVTVLEPGVLGGEFLAGGLKYIHRTDAMVSLFNDIGLHFYPHMVRGGILLDGDVHPYPECLKYLGRSRAVCIQDTHYRKTRRMEPGYDTRRSMNDAASANHDSVYICFRDMVALLEKQANIIGSAMTGVRGDHVTTSNGCLPFDFLVMTTPLWVTKRCVEFFVPDAVAMRLNVATVVPSQDRYGQWDYVYTPYTAADCVHRFSTYLPGYTVEFNGDLDQPKLEADLDFIFPGGWSIDSIQTGLKGHLLRLKDDPDWPYNIAPIGRFAKWDSRATLDVTLEDSMLLAKRWLDE